MKLPSSVLNKSYLESTNKNIFCKLILKKFYFLLVDIYSFINSVHSIIFLLFPSAYFINIKIITNPYPGKSIICIQFKIL
jgi:hypothetical protein